MAFCWCPFNTEASRCRRQQTSLGQNYQSSSKKRNCDSSKVFQERDRRRLRRVRGAKQGLYCASTDANRQTRPFPTVLS
ncbi:hypothetical protein TNCV_3844031 [Trichonephila clavipes]|nr:hypothetical protein TNCV_3844031 [Trichonephila clavipes]